MEYAVRSESMLIFCVWGCVNQRRVDTSFMVRQSVGGGGEFDRRASRALQPFPHQRDNLNFPSAFSVSNELREPPRR